MVDIELEFRAGQDLGNWDRFQVPHLLEHLMFTNKTYPKPRQFSIEVEKNGAYHNAHVDNLSVVYVYECAEFEVARIAELAAIQISEPTFPPAEFKTEISNVREELSGAQSNNARLGAANLAHAAIGYPTLATQIQQLASIDRADVVNYYQATHHGDNLRFVIAGDTDFELLTKKLDVKLPCGQRLAIPVTLATKLKQPIVARRDIDQVFFNLFSERTRRFSYRQLIAARIVTNLLSDGFSSLLFGLARERGLIYNMGMGVEDAFHSAILRLSGSVTPGNAKAFFKLVAEQVALAKSGRFTKSEFDQTRERMLGQRAISYQQLSNLTSYYDTYFTEDEVIPFETFDQLLAKIDKAEATAAFRELFSDDSWGLSLVGPTDSKSGRLLQHSIEELWADGSRPTSY